ncbi:hypothetical protein FBU30_008376 [Linnemannia zychae]|nr:hypothetical protein FBU30_008376 [Linnemannia zychae]
MKWEHDSDSEDVTMVATKMTESDIDGPAALKESLLVQEYDDSLMDRNQDPLSSHLNEIQGEVSHTTVGTNPNSSQSMTTTISYSQESVLATLTSSKEPDVSKPKTHLSLSTPDESISSRPVADYTQTSGGTFHRSGYRSFSTPSAFSYSPPTMSMSSIIHSKESVYAAVPVSSELYIIPKSSCGFHWNGDLFLKPHQRRSLGIDHMFSSSSASQQSNRGDYGGAGPSNSQHQNQHIHNQDSYVMVHEIHLDEHEIDGILPSWP